MGQGGSVSTLEWHKWAGQGSTKAMNREQWHGTYGHRSLSHFVISYYRMVNSHCFHVFSFSSLLSNQALLIPRNCSSLSQQWVKPNHLFSVSLLSTVFGPLSYAKSPQQQSHLVPQALNILMAPQFNSSSSTSPLSFRFTCWIAYLISPIGSWMNISKLVRLKPNLIFTSTHTPKTSPAVFPISESTNAYVERKTWSHPWCSFLCHTSHQQTYQLYLYLESVHFSTLPSLPP